MKYLITTIAAVVLVGCGPSVDIHQACKDGNIEAVKQYLAAGWDVNARDKSSLTPLLLAASFRNDDIAKLLISSGANVSAKCNFGTTPLHYCGKEIAELLIAKGADVNAMSGSGTPLHHVLTKERAELLIANGADVNAKEKGGFTLLHVLAGDGRKEIAELLIAKGADVNAKCDNGFTPLDRAVQFERIKVAELLIANGANLNVVDEFNKTLLDYATDPNVPITSREEIAELLRKHGGKTAEELKAEGK